MAWLGVKVTALSTTAVKGTRLRRAAEIELTRNGARGDRRFFLIDDRGRMVNGKHLGALNAVVASFAEASGRLALELPDGERVEGTVEAPGDNGAAVRTRFYSRELEARVVEGPWSAALSGFLGKPVQLVAAAAGAVDRGRRGGASLISQASLARLAEVGGQDAIDSRRFRMLIEFDGTGAHEEDTWVGRTIRVGEALIRVGGHVGRCLITSRDPETGEIDVPTLDILRGYRDDLGTTEPLPFGVYGEVREPGRVRLGDPVAVVQ